MSKKEDFWGRATIEEASKYAIAVECSSCIRIFPTWTYATSKICDSCVNIEWLSRMAECLTREEKSNDRLRKKLSLYESAYTISI